TGREGRRDAWLQHGVPLDDAAGARIECRAIERVSHLADQPLGGSPRQARIAIEGDDVADAVGHDRREPVVRDESRVACAAQQSVELVQLAALALPPDPLSLALVPPSSAMKQEEPIAVRRRFMAAIQLRDAFN